MPAGVNVGGGTGGGIGSGARSWPASGSSGGAPGDVPQASPSQSGRADSSADARCVARGAETSRLIAACTSTVPGGSISGCCRVWLVREPGFGPTDDRRTPVPSAMALKILDLAVWRVDIVKFNSKWKGEIIKYTNVNARPRILFIPQNADPSQGNQYDPTRTASRPADVRRSTMMQIAGPVRLQVCGQNKEALRSLFRVHLNIQSSRRR